MNILVAVDGSEAALHACALVAGFAGGRPALRITLLNVQRPPVHFLPQAGLQQPQLEEALREQAERQLQEARAAFAAGGIPVETVVRIGPPADTILHEARERGVAALVMGSGRRGLVGGYAVGSVALRVAPAASCPVVLVQPGAQLPQNSGRSVRVTAPVDGSRESARAVERLAACAPLLGRMHVDLVHFQPGLSLAAAILPPHDDVLKEWGALGADEALAAPARTLAAAGIAHEVHRVTGTPEVGIASFARQNAADLIVMATRGRGAMHHLLLGSVALRTAHESQLPVLLMR